MQKTPLAVLWSSLLIAEALLFWPASSFSMFPQFPDSSLVTSLRIVSSCAHPTLSSFSSLTPLYWIPDGFQSLDYICLCWTDSHRYTQHYLRLIHREHYQDTLPFCLLILKRKSRVTFLEFWFQPRWPLQEDVPLEESRDGFAVANISYIRIWGGQFLHHKIAILYLNTDFT